MIKAFVDTFLLKFVFLHCSMMGEAHAVLNHPTFATFCQLLSVVYPTDVKAKEVDKQFLWGPAFMVTPVLEEGKSMVEAYVPDDVWYDYYTGARVEASGHLNLPAPRGFINLHVRGGFILPAQKPALNTALSRQNDFELIVALNKDKIATGHMFWDDGESTNSIENGLYQIQNFNYAKNTLNIEVTKGGAPKWPGISPKLDKITMLGIDSPPKTIIANGKMLDPNEFSFYDKKIQVLILENLSLDLNQKWVVEFEY